jgi:hypothetical protein
MTCYHSVLSGEYSRRKRAEKKVRDKNHFHVPQHRIFPEKLE